MEIGATSTFASVTHGEALDCIQEQRITDLGTGIYTQENTERGGREIISYHRSLEEGGEREENVDHSMLREE